MTTPDQPVGGSAGPADEGVIRVFPGPPPETPETVAPASGGASYSGPPRSGSSYPTTPPPVGPPPVAAPPAGPPSTSDEAKSAAGDVKDQAASSAADVKDTAAQQASEVKQTAQQQAYQVKDEAASAAQDVADTAREQVSNVVGEASNQARQIADSLTTQLNEQATTQQQRAAGGIRQLAEGVSDMAEGRGAPSGPLGDYTRQAADRLQTAAGYLESKQPAELLDDVRSFAARRPAAFLFGAAVAGFAVGRLVKGAGVGPGSSGSGRSVGSTGSSASAGVSGSSSSAIGATPVSVTQVPPSAQPDFGTPTPPPGYAARIPTTPIVEEPYPASSSYEESLRPAPVDAPARQAPHGDPLTGGTDVYPGNPGGRSV